MTGSDSSRRLRTLPAGYIRSRSSEETAHLYSGLIRIIKNIPPLAEQPESKPPAAARPVFVFFNCPTETWFHARQSYPGDVWTTEDIGSLRQMVRDFQLRGLEPVVFVGDKTPNVPESAAWNKVNDAMFLAESMPELNISLILLSSKVEALAPSILLPDPDRIRIIPLEVFLTAPFDSMYRHLDFPVQAGQGQVICRVSDGKIVEMPEQQTSMAKATMDEFSGPYNRHMILTGHFDAMFEAYRQLFVNAGPDIFRNRIIDLGCGTGYPLWRVVSGLFVPQLLATAEIASQMQAGTLSAQDVREMQHLMRSRLDLLLVDRSPQMLAQARSLFEHRIEEREWLKGDLATKSLAEDIMNLNPGILGDLGFGSDVTAIVSMVIHWQPQDQKEAFARHLASLLTKGSTLITVEEFPQTVSPSPYLPKELIEKIHRDLRPVTMDDYYSYLFHAGFTPVPAGYVIVPIDRSHDYHICAFTKD